MMVSESQAKVLHQLVHLFGASRILELGTFTGFSTLAMATALRATDKLISIEVDPKPHAVACQYIEKLRLQDRVDLRLGQAMDSLVSLANDEPRHQFDLIFLDADKRGYIPYFDFIMDNDLLSDRGVIIADNVLYFGQVHRTAGFESDKPVEASKRIRKGARYVHEFNQHVLHDPRVQVVMLPLFDGVSFIRKNHS
ncbi:O-methyltransferase [Fennellomyces sp. T-0311]|nr:O-methyltransferase [Fennellomyces sp. T-0311]